MKPFNKRPVTALIAVATMVGLLLARDPALASAAASNTQPQTPSRSVCATYTVRWGDTLANIAGRYGTTWQAIAQANHLRHPNLIFAGTRLAIPCSRSKPEPTASGGAFASALYGYAIKYPAGWTVSVDRPEAAGVGEDPENVTLQPAGGGLPSVRISVLTGAAPFTGFEGCQPSISFAGMKACKSTQPAGQNPAQDLWVFQRGDEHYLIGLLYEDAVDRAAGKGIVETFDFTQ